MSSFLNIFGGNTPDAVPSVDEVAIDIKEADVDNVVEGNQIGSVIETGTNWIKEHPIFVLWAVVAIAGLVYLAYFRNTDPDDAAVEEALLGKNTDELMDDLKLDLNLTKNVKEEHLSLSSDEDEDEDESQGNKENDRIEELSNDLKELEEYTQESMDI
tara:strand:+ start:1701 stop:2174 length:474 start_codon:yes stop_codon:yes gene_type:complete